MAKYKKGLAQKQYSDYPLVTKLLLELNLICILQQTDVAVESCGIANSKTNV